MNRKCIKAGAHIPNFVWIRSNNGYSIHSMRAEHHQDVLNLVLTYFIKKDLVCKLTNLDSCRKSIESFTRQIKYIMEKQTSMVAVDDETDEIVGALLICPVNRLDFGRVYQHECDQNGAAYNAFLSYETELMRQVDIFVAYDCSVFLRFYLLVVKDSHRGKAISEMLLRSGVELGKNMQILNGNLITSCRQLQQVADGVGFETITSISLNPVRDMHYSFLMVDIPPIYVDRKLSYLRIEEPLEKSTMPDKTTDKTKSGKPSKSSVKSDSSKGSKKT